MLRGTILEEEMRHPTLLDHNDEPCLMVIKDGSTTGVTIGRASGIMSNVREYFGNKSETSKEWARFWSHNFLRHHLRYAYHPREEQRLPQCPPQPGGGIVWVRLVYLLLLFKHGEEGTVQNC